MTSTQARTLRLFAGAATLALAAACSSDSAGTGLPDDVGLPAVGSSSGSVSQGGVSIVRFVAARTGSTRIKLCGPSGTNFDLYLPSANRGAATTGVCDSLTFSAQAGTTYRAEVLATSGAGPFAFCWVSLSASDSTCAAVAPVIDATIPAGYYSLAEGRTGTSLLLALNAIIDDQRVLGYDPARDSLYGFVTDPDNNDSIPEVYVGGMRGIVNNRATALAAGLNAEHSWPQSLGATQDPAMSDLNILFPADSIANRQRSNLPFGNVTGDTLYITPAPAGTSPNDRSVLGHATGTTGQVVFEPRDAVKGDIARALLYFFVRYNYNRTASFSLVNFNVEEATLIQWAKQDPPDDYEKARNNLVYRAQGNRNPFIDRPDFLDAIGDFPNQ